MLNSEERQKLFNTFMKEMTHSIMNSSNLNVSNQGSTIKNKKKQHHQGDPLRVVSNSSSRPRSQLGMTSTTQPSNNNYSSMVQT